MAASAEANVILLLTVMAVGSSEELYNYSPFSFIKEIIQYLGDSSEGFDVYSLVEKSPSHVEGVPYHTVLSDRIVEVDNPDSGKALETTHAERQLSLKLVAEPLEPTVPTPDKKSPILSKGEEALPSVKTPFGQNLRDEPPSDLHLVAGPPYFSQQLLVKPTITPIATTTPGELNPPSVIGGTDSPPNDTRSLETSDKERFALKNKDLEKGDSAISETILSQPTRHLDHVPTFQTKDTEAQTTPKPTPCDCLSLTSQPKREENPLEESSNSRFPFRMGDGRGSTSQSSAEQSSSDMPLPLQSSRREVQAQPDLLIDSPSDNEPFRVAIINSTKVTEPETFHRASLTKSHDRHPLHVSHTNLPGRALGTSSTADKLPQLPNKVNAMFFPTERRGSAETEYLSPRGIHGSSEMIPPASFENNHRVDHNSFSPSKCGRFSVLQPSCDSSAVPEHHLQYEDFVESQVYVETPQPILVQNKEENDMNSNVATKQHVDSLSPPALPMFAFSPHYNVPYFDPRSQVPEYNGVPYFFGAKGVGPYSCQTCQRVGQLYHVLPMQTIQPM